MSDDNVVHAFPASTMPENLLAIEPRNPAVPYHCNHEKVTLNEHERVVNCAQCNATLDPFAFLLYNAKTIQMAWSNYREATRKVAELNESVAALTRERKRLQGQVSRLKEKPGVVLDVRGRDGQ
jgi:hypothetical protein